MNEKPIVENPYAFPVTNDANVNGHMGMSLRDYFAIRFASSEIADGKGMEGCYKFLICAMAYELADAMLEARTK